MKKRLVILGTLLSTSVSVASYLPAPIVKMGELFSHHVLIAEKATYKLHLYSSDNGIPKLEKTYQMATGKKSGNKFFQGDHRTPEGAYTFTRFIPNKELIKQYGKQGEIYGVGSFVMDYPNPMDRGLGKTGGGIWLHSTNDETRIEKGRDSRGCVVTANDDLKDISRYIELQKTPIIVVHQLNFLPKEQWIARRSAINLNFNNWMKAWQDENLKKYIASYHPEQYSNPFRKNIQGLRSYKKRVFAQPGAPILKARDLSILKGGDYLRISFVQSYKSATISDQGVKTLYMKRNKSYDWKIVSESWRKWDDQTDGPVDGKLAFRPTMRFFDTDENGRSTTSQN